MIFSEIFAVWIIVVSSLDVVVSLERTDDISDVAIQDVHVNFPELSVLPSKYSPQTAATPAVEAVPSFSAAAVTTPSTPAEPTSLLAWLPPAIHQKVEDEHVKRPDTVPPDLGSLAIGDVFDEIEPAPSADSPLTTSSPSAAAGKQVEDKRELVQIKSMDSLESATIGVKIAPSPSFLSASILGEETSPFSENPDDLPRGGYADFTTPSASIGSPFEIRRDPGNYPPTPAPFVRARVTSEVESSARIGAAEETIIDCSFAPGEACEFESVHSDDSFVFALSSFERRMVAVDKGGHPLPWYREAYLWSPLQSSHDVRESAGGPECLYVDIAFRMRGDTFLRVGIVPSSESRFVALEHPFDDLFFANVSDDREMEIELGKRKATTRDPTWRHLRRSGLVAPREGFQIVIHAGVNFTSYRVVGVVQLRSVVVKKVACPEGAERMTETNETNVGSRPSPVACSQFARVEWPCRNGARCLQLPRRNGVLSEPFCRCDSPWAGRLCEERIWVAPSASEKSTTPASDETAYKAEASDILESSSVSLECSPNGMKIRIPMMTLFLTGHWSWKDAAPCLREDECCMHPNISDQAVFDISFKFYRCGTTFKVENNSIVFQNSIRLGKRESSSQREILFECRTRFSEVAFNATKSPEERQLVFLDESEISADLKVMVDPGKLPTKTLMVQMRDTLTFTVAVTDENLKSMLEAGARVLLDDCWATSNVTGKISPIIKRGCPVIPSVEIFGDGLSPMFSVKVSHLSDDPGPNPIPLVVQCRLALCSSSETESCAPYKCAPRSRGRNARVRRDTLNIDRGVNAGPRNQNETLKGFNSIVSSRVFFVQPPINTPQFLPLHNISSQSSAGEDEEAMTPFAGEVDEGETPSVLEDPVHELVLYAVVAILLTIVIALLISVCVLVSQLQLLRERMQSQMEQALTIQNGGGNSTFKALDGTDYWANFRRILMGGRAANSNYSEGGEFDVAYHDVEESSVEGTRGVEGVGNANNAADSSRDDATDDVTDQFDYRAIPRDGQCEVASKSVMVNSKDRYRFPGSEMTRELYERRGVDLNNNA